MKSRGILAGLILLTFPLGCQGPKSPMTPDVTTGPIETKAVTHKLTGRVTYTGSGVVDAAHSLRLGLYTTNDAHPNNLHSSTSISANGGTYTLPVLAAGTYYLSMSYNSPGAPSFTPINAPYRFYNNNSTNSNCLLPISTPITIIGSTAAPHLFFGDTCRYRGLFGTVQYTGTKGVVDITRKIFVEAYTDATYTQVVSAGSNPWTARTNVKTNGSRYDLLNPTTFTNTPVVSAYPLAFFDNDQNGHFSHGDPYLTMGSLPIHTNFQRNMTFGDVSIRSTCQPLSVPQEPFTPGINTFSIGTDICHPGLYRLEILNGTTLQPVRTLRNVLLSPTIREQVIWDGKNDSGSAVPAGLYRVRLSSAFSVQMANAIVLH